MSTIADTIFKITNTKLYVPIVTLSNKGNVKLLEEGLKRPVYWNEYQTKIETRDLDNKNLKRFPIEATFLLLLITLLFLFLVIQLTILTIEF